MPTCVRPLVFLASWAGLISFGLGELQVHQLTPGEPGKPPRDWPSASGLTRDPGRPTLVIVAHPQCPCTVATLGELARILAEVDGKLTVHVLFLKPSGSGADWSDARTVRAAKALQGVQATEDEAGTRARMFGATTSGQALYYDVQGRLRFSGGITESRGHAGDNPGHSAMVDLVRTGYALRDSTPVFGCSLLQPGYSQ